MPQYEILEHTADLFIKSYGKNAEQCFENIAYAMFDNIVNAEKVENIGELKIQLKADDKERLLVKFLSELLFIFETEKLVFSKFKVKINGNELIANVFGEKFDAKKHGIKNEIKAITYHLLEINEKEGFVKVLFDI